MSLLTELNSHLKDKGLNLFEKPLYKLVWSASELELRHGTFCKYVDNNFISETTETRWVKKYDFYIHDRYILERWCPPEISYNKDLPDSTQGTYEPIYVFEDADLLYLEPNIKVLDFIVTMAEKPHHITQTEIVNELKDKEAKEIQQIMDALDYRSDIGIRLAHKEAIGYTKAMKDKEMVN